MPYAHEALIWIYRADEALQQENDMVNAKIFTHPFSRKVDILQDVKYNEFYKSHDANRIL